MRERFKAITEETFIPISLALVFIGGIAWLTNLNALALETSKRVEAIEIKQEQYNTILLQINERLSRIEGKLGVGKN